MSTLSVQNITGVANLALANGSVTTPALSSAFGQTGIYFPAANTIGFVEGGAEAARIDSSGNLGIGTSSPAQKLDVYGILRSNNIYINNGTQFKEIGYYDNNVRRAVTYYDDVDNIFVISAEESGANLQFSANGAARMRIDSAGNVGIGTTSPGAKLVIEGGTSEDQFRLGTGSNYYRIGRESVSTGYLTFYGTQTGATGYVFSSVNGERMRIDSSGNIGIGTASPAGIRLVVATPSAGVQISATDGTVTHYVGYASSTVAYHGTGSNHPLSFLTNNSVRMTISATGTINFGNVYGVTVTTPRNVFIDSSGNIGGISSIRESKTNITTLPTANWIMDLNPVSFNYRKKDEEGNWTDEYDDEVVYGLIAEELEQVNPDLCIYNDGKLASVHYDRMIAPLIKAIQELKAEFDAYKATH